MIRLLRILGFLLVGAGALVILAWLIEPLRQVWPWFLELPLPIQIGLGVALTGLLLLTGTVLWERIEDREKDKDLLEDKDF
ncbi:MAG: hypothetical protein ACYTG5_09660 [Planctomycetota bacterium]|jgi:4-hydroxybenzoate polyprenyltransferase